MTTTHAVLIVDDELSVLKVLCRQLRKEGYLLLTAENGKKALEIVRTQTIAVILCDQRMPGLAVAKF